MKRIILIFICGVFSILILSTCKEKCESNNLGTVSFTQEDLQIVPYKGTETLTFKDSLGNKILTNGIGHISIYKDYYSQFINNNSDPNFCEGNYFYSDHLNYQFNGEDLIIWIDLLFNRGNPFYSNKNKIINLRVAYSDSKSWNFIEGFSFDSIKIKKSLDTSITKFFFKDSLMIGNNKYYSVYVLIQLIPPYKSNNLKYVFYTIKEGIVGFKTEDMHTWYLSN